MEEKNLKKNLQTFIDCICMKCPSHNGCMKVRLQKVFCAADSTGCEVQDKGCYCPRCKVAKDYGLDGTYYCKTGRHN